MSWPEAHYLGPLHPVLDWASHRALSEMSRNEVLVARGDVDAAQVLLMGTLMNRCGQVKALTRWMLSPTPDGNLFLAAMHPAPLE
jgi:hypothetical protein